jgi:hypothetical protein
MHSLPATATPTPSKMNFTYPHQMDNTIPWAQSSLKLAAPSMDIENIIIRLELRGV